MDQIVLKADINTCKIEGWNSNTGEVNARTLTVEMCDEMCKCAMSFVTFELKDGTLYESLVTDGKANIPTIEEAQFIKVGLYSADIEGDKCVKRYSPHPTNAYINNGSYSGNGTEAPTPAAGTFEELLDKIENIVVETDNIKNGAVTVDKVNQSFFKDGIACNTSDDIEFAITQKQPNPKVYLTAFLKNKATEVTETSTDEEIPTAKAVYDLVKSMPSGSGGGTVSPTSILKTLKCGVLGDSITYGAGVNHDTQSYPALLKADFKEAINYGISATLIAKNDSYPNAMCERYVNMADDLDVIIVMGGTNDFAVGSSVVDSFGEPTSTDIYTFYGALNVLMSGLIDKYAGKEIFFCTPIHIKYGDYNSDTVKANGKTLNDYRNAIIERCAYYSIPCIDLYAISGMDIAHSQKARNYFTWDGCHPNVKGHIRLHDRILNEVSNRIGCVTQATEEIPPEEPEETTTLESISAVFEQGDTVIYIDTSLDSLKNMLTVTAHYDDGTTATVTGYTLSGTLTVGTSVITVSYGGKTTTFTVNVSETPVATLEGISAVYNQGEKVIYTTDSIETLKDDLIVTALYSDETSAIVSDYELSGVLAEGTSTITVFYEGKTATFTVNVTKFELVGYTQYSYLQGDGNSYIDTGVKPNQDTKFEIKTARNSATEVFTPLEAWGSGYYFGLNTSGAYLCWCWGVSYPYVQNSNNTTGEYVFSNDKGLLYNNGTEVCNAHSESINRPSAEDLIFSIDYSMFMFANNSSGSPTSISTNNTEIYYCKIWNGDTLVRDFIPVKRDSDNAIGMYDLVTKTFFENKGTGTFGTGEVVTE